MPRFFIKRPDIKPRAQSQPILAIDTLSCAVSCELPCSINSLAFNCIAAQYSCSIRVHSSSLVFSRVPFVFTRVLFVFTRVHSCSLVFTSVHSCSDSCGVLDQILYTLAENNKTNFLYAICLLNTCIVYQLFTKVFSLYLICTHICMVKYLHIALLLSH